MSVIELESYIKSRKDLLAEMAGTGVGFWNVVITPLRLADKTATFRVQWIRALKNVAIQSETLQLTLKLGESRPLDSILIPPTKVGDARPCDVKAASLRVSLQFGSYDRRLVGFDVWLVERLANGKEDSQLQSVRGLPDHDIHFYFDSVLDGTARIDIFGRIVASLDAGSLTLDVEAVKAKPDIGQNGYQAAQWYRSTTQVKPGETVEVALPVRGTDDELKTRTFSIRIRAKQIR